jgi:hypothetical protein
MTRQLNRMTIGGWVIGGVTLPVLGRSEWETREDFIQFGVDYWADRSGKELLLAPSTVLVRADESMFKGGNEWPITIGQWLRVSGRWTELRVVRPGVNPRVARAAARRNRTKLSKPLATWLSENQAKAKTWRRDGLQLQAWLRQYEAGEFTFAELQARQGRLVEQRHPLLWRSFQRHQRREQAIMLAAEQALDALAPRQYVFTAPAHVQPVFGWLAFADGIRVDPEQLWREDYRHAVVTALNQLRLTRQSAGVPVTTTPTRPIGDGPVWPGTAK